MQMDTIAAIATAMTNSGIGVIRISGCDTFKIIDKIFKFKNKKKRITELKSHTIHYGYVYDNEKLIDEVLLLIMKAPNSYTCEDTIEIDCHGGVLIMQTILNTVIKQGARLAEPGEFTKRAFLSGRIDLSQAESVMDIINSKSEFGLAAAMKQLKGDVYNIIKDLRAEIIYEVAFIESFLDDPEHISISGFRERLLKLIEKISLDITNLIRTFENGELLKEGIQTAIIGCPNVGKSSLLNLLLGREKAIVTDIAGTTRDAIEEQITINGLILNIIDTAGIHDTDDTIELLGVRRSKEILLNSDLILYVIDGSKVISEEEKNILLSLKEKKVIYLINKADLPLIINLRELENFIKEPVIEISVKKKIGIEAIYDRIVGMFFQGDLVYNDQVIITSIRHKVALNNAFVSLGLVKEGLDHQIPEDLLTIDLMDAYEELGYIIGESLAEDITNEIFSKFCTGK